MTRRVRDAVLVTLAIVAFGLSIFGCGSSSSTSRSAGASATPDDRATAAAKRFLDRYVLRDGRVSRRDQGGDTVGEGQAYAMLMAAAIDDPRRFNLVWDWTKAHLQRPDGLISFLWKDGRVQDPQAASDADLDASRALLVAGCRFRRPGLRQEGIRLGDAVMRIETADVNGHPVLVAGPWAITPKIVMDPSYFSPATYAALRAATGNPKWDALATTSRGITNTLMPAPGRLPPDWAFLEGGKPVPVASPTDTHSPPRFSFDAVRTLVRFAEDHDATGRDLAARAWPVFAKENPNQITVERDLNGRPVGNILHPVGMVAAAGAADAAGQTAARDGLLDAAENLDSRSPTYYGASWVALGRIILQTNLLTSCTS